MTTYVKAVKSQFIGSALKATKKKIKERGMANITGAILVTNDKHTVILTTG
jgi:hypothetical protein